MITVFYLLELLAYVVAPVLILIDASWYDFFANHRGLDTDAEKRAFRDHKAITSEEGPWR